MAQENRKAEDGAVTGVVVNGSHGQSASVVSPEIVRDLALNVGSQDFPEYVKRLWEGPLRVQDAVQDAQDIIKLQSVLLPATIQQTKPQDWVMFGDKLYFQGTGGERINGIWGMLYGKPSEQREDFPDGTYAYTYRGPCASTRTRVVYQEIIGGRWSGEPFFKKTERDENGQEVTLPVNPLDVKKAAFTNWLINAISRTAGLRGLEIKDLERFGFKRCSEIKGFQFDSGAKGGKGRTASAGGAITCPPKFGPANCRGKAITDPAVTVANLEWYAKMAQKNLDDESKAQYHTKETAWLTSLNQELERRAGNAEAEPDEKF